VYPGLAVAQTLVQRFPCRLFWIGGNRGMERAIVEAASPSFPGGIPFFGVPSGKLRRYFSLRNVGDVFRVAGGFFAARRILRKEKPALLFSKGGFVSVPPCAAAASLGIPVFSHESDYSPGLATRINARFSDKIFVTYQETARFIHKKYFPRICCSGHPVRPEFFLADPLKGRAFLGIPEGEPILLILGGSQGSGEINALVEKTLPELTRVYRVVHQTGDSTDRSSFRTSRYLPFRYLREEMPQVLAAADLVLCRSGAGTLWECAVLRKPMVLIPLRGSGTRGDQVENARVFSDADAAVVMPEGFTSEDLVGTIKALAGDEPRRKALSKSLEGIAQVNASAFIADSIEGWAGRHNRNITLKRSNHGEFYGL